MVAVAIAGAGLASAGASIFGSSKAADAQKDSAAQATAAQLQMFNQTTANEQPFVNNGVASSNTLLADLQRLTNPVHMNENMLQNTPGYQFNLTQGLKSVQNSAAARGLGISGAAMKGASSYATGLADSTYQNQFNNTWTNRNNEYNMLSGQAGIGQSAAANVANSGTQVGQGIAQNTIGAGNAQAAAYNSIGSAVGGAANSVASAYTTNALLSALGGNGSAIH